MSSTQYMPRQAMAFYTWSQTFASYATSAGNPLGLPQSLIDAINAAIATLAKPPISTTNSHHPSTAPGGGNDPNAHKARLLFRAIVKRAKADPGIPPLHLIAAGANPNGSAGNKGGNKKPKTPAPTAIPGVIITPGQHGAVAIK